jgi:hypothetical protein
MRTLRQIQLWHPVQFTSVLLPSRVMLGLPPAFEEEGWLFVTLERSLVHAVLRASLGIELPGPSSLRAMCRWHLGAAAEHSRSFELALRSAAAGAAATIGRSAT